MRNNYNTKQKELITTLIASTATVFTVKELHASAQAIDPEIGLTTVYRIIDKCLDERLVKKVFDATGAVCYQYTPPCPQAGHCHLQCQQCNRLEHIDCQIITQLTQHIHSKHHFTANLDHLTISGLCSRCQRLTPATPSPSRQLHSQQDKAYA
ncbi:transcriptional repressor [Candidatus Saccharibacteria bacterium]|nr:transcriptional repressor [Candidatus Saccharibacteria bacterium]